TGTTMLRTGPADGSARVSGADSAAVLDRATRPILGSARVGLLRGEPRAPDGPAPSARDRTGALGGSAQAPGPARPRPPRETHRPAVRARHCDEVGARAFARGRRRFAPSARPASYAGRPAARRPRLLSRERPAAGRAHRVRPP